MAQVGWADLPRQLLCKLFDQLTMCVLRKTENHRRWFDTEQLAALVEQEVTTGGSQWSWVQHAFRRERWLWAGMIEMALFAQHARSAQPGGGRRQAVGVHEGLRTKLTDCGPVASFDDLLGGERPSERAAVSRNMDGKRQTELHCVM